LFLKGTTVWFKMGPGRSTRELRGEPRVPPRAAEKEEKRRGTANCELEEKGISGSMERIGGAELQAKGGLRKEGFYEGGRISS